MKFKTTVNELKNGYNYVIQAGYCELQSLLSYKDAVAFTCGLYGWNFDVYDINGIAIVTGYRGMFSKNSKADYKLIREYEDKSQGKTKEEKEVLIKEFINLAIKK
jgi:hypothetical protein